MCSRAASDSVRQECGGYHCEFAAGPWCFAHFCADPFVMCLKYVPKTVQNAIRILLPHFHSETLIFDWKSFKTVIVTVLSLNVCKALFYGQCSCFLLFSEKRSVLIKMDLCFGKRFRAVKILCKNRSICTKDTAPTFFNQKSKYPPDTAHTNSSREQLLVTKKLSAVFR